MIIDRGLNHAWIHPNPVRRLGKGRYAITLRETLGQSWDREIVRYPLPDGVRARDVRVVWEGRETPCQISGDMLAILVEGLQPHEERVYELDSSGASPGPRATPGISVVREKRGVVLSNGVISLLLPATNRRVRRTGEEAAPGPVIAIRRGRGPWLGRGGLESPRTVRSVQTRVTEAGALWTTVEVTYRFEGGYSYRVRLSLRPGEDACEVEERSTLPVRLWPAPRPYREIGSLGSSFWKQDAKDFAKPCLRPCPTSNFIFDLRVGLRCDRMVTHSTGSWEMMDVPLGSPTLKTYTAMRPAVPFVDGGWMGVYNSRRDELLGVASVDIAAWRGPDDMIHPAHRMPGANAEVLLLDSRADGSHWRFPIENLQRRWLLAVASRKDSPGLGTARQPAGRAVRLDPNPDMPLWRLHRRRSALPLNTVKDWVADWPDAGHAHPRLYLSRAEIPAIRKKVRAVPELWRHFRKTGRLHCADRYLMGGAPGRLAEVEAATHAKELVEGILAKGYAGPTYAIGLARPVRRYVVACDILWDGFTAEERREARRVCALAAYIMTDGGWWQYPFRDNETTYLPNFNSDVFCCVGLLGLFLSDHPCSRPWVQFLVDRMDVELPRHLRRDGGGEENVGCYLPSTWTMLYFPALWALRRNGIKDYSRDPNILAGARFFLKTIAPPDARDKGLRQLPPIGHHPYARKAMPLAAFLAAFVKKADPALASHLMWMWRATGSPIHRNYDHSGPLAEPFTRHYVFHDPSIRAVPPSMGSHNLPHVGAVLRSHDMSGKGSYLFLKAGRVHSHHDDDEGSFHYYGRGVPLALDGLPLQNGATAQQHNAVTFARPGQPTALVEHFRSTPAADYVRARVAPRAFCSDPMYVDGTHRSGWERQLVFVKADRPGGVEYLVVKDTTCGPDACQWNLDVLSRRPPEGTAKNGRVWFPGHPDKGFGVGLDVIVLEPFDAPIVFEKGVVNPALLTARGRRELTTGKGGSGIHLMWTVNEHWLMHIPAAAGSTFVVVLFPRRADEMAPVVRYLEREETMEVAHGEGRDLIFLRPTAMVDTSIGGAIFQGRAGIVRERQGRRSAQALDAARCELVDYPDRKIRML